VFRFLFFTVSLFLFVLCSFSTAQQSTLLSKTNNGFTSRVEFKNTAFELRRSDNVHIMNFPEAVDESKPGIPALPGKTVYIAIPPNEKISVKLSNVQRHTYSNVVPSANPKVISNADSTFSYEDAKLNYSLFSGFRYPASDVEVLGYTWLGNYYCAAVNINTFIYNGDRKEISELQGTDIRVTYQNHQSEYKKNSTPLSQYEQDLRKVIINYDLAQDFRSFRTILSFDTSDDWIDYTKQYIKLAIPVDGIYRITYDDLVNTYQINPSSLNPRTFRIYESGKEKQIYVSGEDDMVFNTNDFIEFYGTRHYEQQNYRTIVQTGKDYINFMNRYSDTTVVWLTWGGTNGLRANVLDASGSSSDTINSCFMRLHIETDQRLWYYDATTTRTQLPFWQEHKVWTWLNFGAGTNTTVPFIANSVLQEGKVNVIARFISNGWDTRFSSTNAHKVGIGLNSANVSDTTFFNHRQTINFQVQFPSSQLNTGNNSIRLWGFPTNTSANVNQFLLDWVDIDYYCYTQAVNDSLFITIPDTVTKGIRMVKVTGLTVADPVIYKVASTVTKIIKYSISGSSQKICLFVDTVSGGDRYVVISEANLKKPRFVVKKSFQNLRSTNRAADYIIVSNKILSASVAQYSSFIASIYGVRTEIAYVDDIFDEFSFGYNYPEAIKVFLIQANLLWKAPSPSYLMLMGEANYDYRNITTGGVLLRKNLVPSYGYPVSDVWYTTWDSVSIDVPQMYVGRIPAKSDAEVIFYLQKHDKYLLKPYDEWNKTFLFFSGGDPTKSSELMQIRDENNKVFSTLALTPPVGGLGHHFYKTTNPVSNYGPFSQQEIQNAIQQSSLFISYIGHSGTQTWDNGIISVNDLKNIYSNRFAVISDFGCSTGKFAEPDIDCFGELFVSGDNNGQAISYLGNASLGYVTSATTFPSLFYGKILKDTVTTVSKAHHLAKLQLSSSEANRVFKYCNLLFGDPILKIALPRKPNFALDEQSVQLLGNIPTDMDDSVNIKVITKNLGLIPQDSSLVTINDKLNGKSIFNYSFKLSPYNFWDTTVVTIPVKNRAGEHELTIFVDSNGVIDEISKKDNNVLFRFSVYSTTVKSLEQNSYYNASKKNITLLNPTQKIIGGAENMRISIDTTENFLNPIEFTKKYDTVITKVSFPTLIEGKRYWWKAKIDLPELEWSIPSSFINVQRNAQLYIESPRTSNDFQYNKTLFNTETGKWELLSGVNNLKILSAGVTAGSFASVEYNGVEKSPNSFFWGIVTARIDSVTLSPFDFRFFVSNSGTTQELAAAADSLTNYINSLSSGTLLAITTSTDAAQSVLGFSAPTAVRNAIKQLGSYYIDSVMYRESWCIIGKKGAPIGSVPENYKRQTDGIANVSISVEANADSGEIIFPVAGIAESWDSLVFVSSIPQGASISLNPIGVKTNSQIDTMASISINSSTQNVLLNQVDASIYPQLKLLAKVHGNVNKKTPQIKNIAFYYHEPSELGTNYQVFHAFKTENNQELALNDTVVQGEKIEFNYRIYNVGGSTAKNIPILLTSIWDNNYVEQITSQTIDSIAPMSYKEIISRYNTLLGSGKRNIQLSIDPDTTIREIYKDNNFYSFPLIIKKSIGNPQLPNLAITQNAIASIPSQITDEIDTAQFSIVYSNTGSLVNDSISIQIKHFYLSNLQITRIVRRKYPVSRDTIKLAIPILKNAGEHQLSIELDYNGLIVESSESDNIANYYFTVATTDFKVLYPSANSISSVNQMIFLNPTISTGSSSTITLELDTLSSYSTAQTFSKQSQQFSTSFFLPGLKKLKRYYWRVKVVNSTRDWTTGSFYSGDSAVPAFGQLDSISWKQNTYTRTAYSLDSGARIVDTRIGIKALSAGFSDGNNGSITINGFNVITPILGSGHNVVVVDTNSFTVLSQRRFNINASPGESDSLTQYIAAIPNGRYVIDVVVDEGANNLTTATRNALKTIGSAYIDQVLFRDSWSIIGRKGAAIGSVPEAYKAQNSGNAIAETTIVRIERSGIVETPLIGPFTSLSSLLLDQSVPVGSQLKVQFVGISSVNTFDTLLTAINQNNVSLSSINTKKYRNGKLVFNFSVPSALKNRRTVSVVNSPVLKRWQVAATSSTELAVSNQSSKINRDSVMEGEVIQFSGKIFNVSNVAADSVLVQLKTTVLGIDNILKQQQFVQIPSNDSVNFSFSYESRGKQGNYAFVFEIDPLNNLSEQSKSNNSVTIPYKVQSDTLRPTLQITFDGSQIVNGDYVAQHPEIRIRYTDNNPSQLLPTDTSNFKITLNNVAIPFTKGTAELLNTNTIGRADIRWTPMLTSGENVIQIYAKDIAGNYSDTLLIYINVAADFKILDIFNLPNPFNNSTAFTFNLAGPANPDEVIIKIYTVTGRLIQELSPGGIIGFNKIPWDGRDKDGDSIGNGVYLYKIIVRQDNKQVEGLSKLVKMR